MLIKQGDMGWHRKFRRDSRKAVME